LLIKVTRLIFNLVLKIIEPPEILEGFGSLFFLVPNPFLYRGAWDKSKRIPEGGEK